MTRRAFLCALALAIAAPSALADPETRPRRKKAMTYAEICKTPDFAKRMGAELQRSFAKQPAHEPLYVVAFMCGDAVHLGGPVSVREMDALKTHSPLKIPFEFKINLKARAA